MPDPTDRLPMRGPQLWTGAFPGVIAGFPRIAGRRFRRAPMTLHKALVQRDAARFGGLIAVPGVIMVATRLTARLAPASAPKRPGRVFVALCMAMARGALRKAVGR
jgi:hypothetical protein